MCIQHVQWHINNYMEMQNLQFTVEISCTGSEIYRLSAKSHKNLADFDSTNYQSPDSQLIKFQRNPSSSILDKHTGHTIVHA